MHLCSFDVFYFAVAALKSFLKHTITLMFFYFALPVLKSFLKHTIMAALKSFLKHTIMAALKKLFDQSSSQEGHNDSSVRGIGFLNTYRF